MRFAQRFGSLLVLALACYSRPRGHGELAVIAASILPRSSPQVCVTVPADSGRPYPTGYTRCTREPDSAVTVTLTDKGEVTSVAARVSRTADRSFDQLLSGLQRAYEHGRSEEHTSELQSPCNLVCRLLLEKKK